LKDAASIEPGAQWRRLKQGITQPGTDLPPGFHTGQGGIDTVALSEIDRNLLARCLARKPRAWEDFVDRFMGLAIHVINHSAQARSIRLTAEDREDLCGEVFLTLVGDVFDGRCPTGRGAPSLEAQIGCPTFRRRGRS
jgi:hypothetical protein